MTLEAKAGCDEASKSESAHGPEMLPGRECISCHRGYTAAGTVFGTLNATCNTGVDQVKLEFLDSDGNAKVTVMTNRVGNFYTQARIPSPMHVRMTGPDGQMQEQTHAKDDGNCTRCHRLPAVEMARGRLALFVPPKADAGVSAAAGSGAAD